MVNIRRRNTRMVNTALPGNDWISDIQGDRSDTVNSQLMRLWLEISQVHRTEEEPDELDWTCA